MLIIRKEQIEFFKQYRLSLFENRMVKHLYTYFPKKCDALGEAMVRNFIRQGIDRTRIYGIRAEKDVSRFINLMLTFGKDFDTDSQLPWAQEILVEKKFDQRISVMDALYQKAANPLFNNRKLS